LFILQFASRKMYPRETWWEARHDAGDRVARRVSAVAPAAEDRDEPYLALNEIDMPMTQPSMSIGSTR
jgi:hypothetical protein